MRNTSRLYTGALLAQASCSTSAADAYSIRHEIDVFFSSGIGSIVFIVLMLLLLLWLLLPLALFGLKSKIKGLIRENRETNRLLTDIRNQLAALSVEDDEAYADPPQSTANRSSTADLYNEIKFDP